MLSPSLCKNYLQRWRVFIWNHKLYHPILSVNVLCYILVLFFSAQGINFPFSYLIFTVGRRRIQHWEGSPCSDTEAENHGVLWKEGETNWTAKENVSLLGLDSWLQSLSLLFLVNFLQNSSSLANRQIVDYIFSSTVSFWGFFLGRNYQSWATMVWLSVMKESFTFLHVVNVSNSTLLCYPVTKHHVGFSLAESSPRKGFCSLIFCASPETDPNRWTDLVFKCCRIVVLKCRACS